MVDERNGSQVSEQESDEVNRPSGEPMVSEDPLLDIRQELRPGKGVAIYLVEHNPEKTIHYDVMYENTRWKQGIDGLLIRLRPHRLKMIRDAELKQIDVMFGFEPLSSSEIEEMYHVADITESKLVTKELQNSSQIVGVEMAYVRGTELITVTMMMPQSQTSLRVSEGEHVRAGTIDAVFTSDSHGNRLRWTENGQGALRYEIRVGHGVTKQELLNIAINMVLAE